MKEKAKNPKKIVVPENSKKMMGNPYLDWVYRWKLENFECSTLYYTAEIEAFVIDTTLQNLKKTTSFKINYLYNGNQKNDFKITKTEQDYLIKELEKLRNEKWEKDLFPFSECLKPNEVSKALAVTEKLSTEKEKNMCSIIYTFSKPIFMRENTIALYLDQKRYRDGNTQLEFSFYRFEQNNWEKIAIVYSYYEH